MLCPAFLRKRCPVVRLLQARDYDLELNGWADRTRDEPVRRQRFPTIFRARRKTEVRISASADAGFRMGDHVCKFRAFDHVVPDSLIPANQRANVTKLNVDRISTDCPGGFVEHLKAGGVPDGFDNGLARQIVDSGKSEVMIWFPSGFSDRGILVDA